MTQKKLILYSIKNVEDFNYNCYILDKKQEVVEKLAKILIIDFDIQLNLFEGLGNKKINFEKVKDEHYGLESSKKEVKCDLFFGNRKLFLTLLCSDEDRVKFNESLSNNFVMPKPKLKKSKSKK